MDTASGGRESGNSSPGSRFKVDTMSPVLSGSGSHTTSPPPYSMENGNGHANNGTGEESGAGAAVITASEIESPKSPPAATSDTVTGSEGVPPIPSTEPPTEGSASGSGDMLSPGSREGELSVPIIELPDGDVQDEDKLIRQESSASTNLYLYQDDISERPQVSSLINSLANYSATIQQGPTDPDAKPVEKANLGTLMGVYLPCIQNIFGVILFIRMTWIVGTAGAIQGFCVVGLACCVTMLTAISMAAIATNGVVPGGGSYFMISRALGPEFGGAVGILFYLATTVAGAMYIIGAVEIMMVYLVGAQMSLFGDDIGNPSIKFNNYRVYGTILLILMGSIVFVGVKFVNKFAGVALACVLLTILSIYIGIAVNFNGNDNLNFCQVGTRIVQQVNECSKEFGTDLYFKFCVTNETVPEGQNLTSIPEEKFVCDEYFNSNIANWTQGIRGLASGIFVENIGSKYRHEGEAISSSPLEPEYNLGGSKKMGYITADIYTTFTILVGIFFPSCTGIMAGSNRSGDLADPQKSIPIGTILAILTTSSVYLSSVLLFAGTVDPLLLRDKFGESIGGSLVVGNIAWPHPKVVEVGSLLSTIGAGLQSLTGAPRLLQAIAKDGIIPFLQPFQVQSSKGEPVRALGITITICEIAVLIGNVDEIAPLLSMFFLMCYGFVNLACALQTLLRTPNWRPRFKFYHWSLSLLGVCLCIAVMFMSSWYYALLAMGIAGVIYKYIEYRGAEKEWGDGLRGLALSAARFSLLRLEEGPPHTKNWRPQILILAKLDSKLNVKYKKLFCLASQLKAGKGLCIGVSVLEGDYGKMYSHSQAAKQSVHRTIKDEGVKGFADVAVAKNTSDGICQIIQTAGLGGMKPNTIILGWPNSWRKKEDESNPCRVFVDTIRNAASAKMAVLVPKGIQQYPDSGDKVKGNIDVWWIVHDGGLLMLLPFLLKQHRTWKNCKMRIFSIAQPEDNSIQMKKDLKTFLYHLRIEADVEVVEMAMSDISSYTYERTLLMEQRNQMLKEMRVSEKRRGKMTRRISLSSNPTEAFNQPDDLLLQAAADNLRSRALDLEKLMVSRQASMISQASASSSGTGNQVDDLMEHSRANEPGGIAMGRTSSKVKFEDVHEETIVEEDESKANEAAAGASPKADATKGNSLNVPKAKRNESSNVQRMHTAVRLNEVMVNKSHEAKLVILNLPSPFKSSGGDKDSNYMEFLEVLTEGLERVMMVRGGGREVITIFS